MPPQPRARFLQPSTLVVSAVTLVLGWITAAVLLVMADDLPDDWWGDSYLPFAAIVVLLAAPVGLLVAWGELDLSVFGTVAAGGYLYAELEADGIAVGIVLAALLGIAIGGAVGVIRWLTRAPSALLTLAAGVLVTAVTVKLASEDSGDRDLARIDGAAVPLSLAAVVIALAAVVGALRQMRDRNGASSPEGPGLDVVIGFAVAGSGAGMAGAVAAGLGAGGPNLPPFGQVGVGNGLLLMVTAIAIGGVVRGAGPIAPVAAGLGGFAAVMLRDATFLNDWEIYDAELLVTATTVVGLALANGLHRALGGLDRPKPAGLAATWSVPAGQPGSPGQQGSPVTPGAPGPPPGPAPAAGPPPAPPPPPPPQSGQPGGAQVTPEIRPRPEPPA